MKIVHGFILILILWNIVIHSYAYAKSNSKYPASTTELTFNVQGQRLSGFIYHAKGQGPHPTVLLLHGYPGNEKNLDAAQAFRRKGWNVVFFHYRGAWGSEGEFSFRNSEQDVQAVLTYLMDNDNAKTLRVDPDFITTVGHSMGGHMAIAGILDNPAVKCAVAWDGANLGAKNVGFINDPNTSIGWKDYSDSLFMLNGWSGEKAEQETTQFANVLDLTKRAEKINGRSVLLVGANTLVIPYELHIAPLIKALKNNNNSKISYILIDDDHSFSAHRKELIHTTLSFLNTSCRK